MDNPGTEWAEVFRSAAACQTSLLPIVEAELLAVEEYLETVGEDAQLANADLQTSLEKLQAASKMMTEMSANLHDTVMMLVRKIGA